MRAGTNASVSNRGNPFYQPFNIPESDSRKAENETESREEDLVPGQQGIIRGLINHLHNKHQNQTLCFHYASETMALTALSNI